MRLVALFVKDHFLYGEGVQTFNFGGQYNHIDCVFFKKGHSESNYKNINELQTALKEDIFTGSFVGVAYLKNANNDYEKYLVSDDSYKLFDKIKVNIYDDKMELRIFTNGPNEKTEYLSSSSVRKKIIEFVMPKHTNLDLSDLLLKYGDLRIVKRINKVAYFKKRKKNLMDEDILSIENYLIGTSPYIPSSTYKFRFNEDNEKVVSDKFNNQPLKDEDDESNYPCKSNYKLRWLNFCRGFGKNGINVENPSPINLTNENAAGYVRFQGLINKNTLGKYDWVADDLNNDGTEHQSKAKIRKRAEAFAHFWYQFNYDNQAIGGVLLSGGFSNNSYLKFKLPDLLRNNVNGNSLRFERDNKLSLPDGLSRYLEGVNPVVSANVNTSSIELEIVLTKFLSRVKQEFENEKQRENY